MALALEKAGAGSAEFWLSMQANYDLFQLRTPRERPDEQTLHQEYLAEGTAKKDGPDSQYRD
jgi:plasmid maintenance system antidote protein VapI